MSLYMENPKGLWIKEIDGIDINVNNDKVVARTKGFPDRDIDEFMDKAMSLYHPILDAWKVYANTLPARQ